MAPSGLVDSPQALAYKDSMSATRQVVRNLTFANQLTFLRLASIPFFVLALLGNRHGLALTLFGAAAITDMLDGLIARILKQKTALGAFLDPAADKLLLTSALITLGLPDHIRIAPEFVLFNHIPLWLTLLAIWRDLFIVLTVLVLYLVYGIGSFPPTKLGKMTTFAEMSLVSLVLFYNSLSIQSVVVIPVAIWGTLAAILVSGFHYVYITSRRIHEAHSETDGTEAGSTAGGPASGEHADDAPVRGDLRVVAQGGKQGEGGDDPE
jgi:cardiolipin synthase